MSESLFVTQSYQSLLVGDFDFRGISGSSSWVMSAEATTRISALGQIPLHQQAMPRASKAQGTACHLLVFTLYVPLSSRYSFSLALYQVDIRPVLGSSPGPLYSPQSTQQDPPTRLAPPMASERYFMYWPRGCICTMFQTSACAVKATGVAPYVFVRLSI
jgi:hypothetical protein